MKVPAKKHFETREQCIEFLGTLSCNNLIQWLADYLMYDTTDKVVLTKEQFEAFFRIREESGEGRRGRPKKSE